MTLRWQSIVVDCADSERVGRFWSEVLGLPLQGPEGDDQEYWIEVHGGCPDILFVNVPDAKTTKNRLHIDLRPDDQTAEVDRVIALGARHVDIGQGDVSWVVLADPEGNEFCILRALPEAQ